MSKEIVARLDYDTVVSEIFMKSGLFKDTKKQSEAIVKILAGREIGLEPIESMTGIHIVKDKISFGANVMAAAVKRNPEYDYLITEHTNEKCLIEFSKNGTTIYTSEFTMQDAKLAGVVKEGSPWIKYPRNMLFARAMSNGVRFACPDVFGNAPVYVPEELGAEVNEDGEPINITPEPFEELVETIIPLDIINGVQTPFDAWDKIEWYAQLTKGKGQEVLTVLNKYVPDYNGDINDVDEEIVIDMVEELTGHKYGMEFV